MPIGAFIQHYSNKQNIEDKRAHDKELWHMQNLYNDPAEQMDRLQKAGLNPHLAFGEIGNMADAVPDSSKQETSPFSNIGQNVTNNLLMQTQRKNIEADTELKQAEVDSKRIDQETQRERNQADLNEFKLRESQIISQVQQTIASTNFTKAQISEMKETFETRYAQLIADFENTVSDTILKEVQSRKEEVSISKINAETSKLTQEVKAIIQDMLYKSKLGDFIDVQIMSEKEMSKILGYQAQERSFSSPGRVATAKRYSQKQETISKIRDNKYLGPILNYTEAVMDIISSILPSDVAIQAVK